MIHLLDLRAADVAYDRVWLLVDVDLRDKLGHEVEQVVGQWRWRMSLTSPQDDPAPGS